MEYSEYRESFDEDEFCECTENLTFPATKADILVQAGRQHLPAEIISELENLPDKCYNSVDELILSATQVMQR